jgi:ribonuclease P protein component
VAKQFTLGKNERLKSRKAIDALFNKGQRFTAAPFRVFYKPVEEEGLLMGVAVGTKHFKKAVDRNRIKRMIREAWRLKKTELANLVKEQKKGLHVFIVFTANEIPEFRLVSDKMNSITQKLVAGLS